MTTSPISRWARGRLFDESGNQLYPGPGPASSPAPSPAPLELSPHLVPSHPLAPSSSPSPNLLLITTPKSSDGLIEALGALDQNLPFLTAQADLSPTQIEELSNLAYEASLRHSQGQIAFFSTTSGSSGRPKVIARTWESWEMSFEAHNLAFALDATQKWLVPGHMTFSATLYHSLLGLFLGKDVYLQSSLSPSQTKKMIMAHQIDTLLTVPTRLMLILDRLGPTQTTEGAQATQASRSLNKIITVGEVLTQKCISKAQSTLNLDHCFHYYGAAELGQVAYGSYAEHTTRPRFLGHPFKDVTLTIDSENNIIVDSPYTALDFPCPATVFDKGFLDPGGLLYFYGRTDLQFNRYGKKINLEPLDGALSSHPLIAAHHFERIPIATDTYNLHVLASTLGLSTSPEGPALTSQAILALAAPLLAPAHLYLYAPDQARYTGGGKLDWRAMKDHHFA